jgi:hypothetical protein
MSGPGAGFEFPTFPVTWLKRDLLLFAASIGCTSDELHFLYVSPGISSIPPQSSPPLARAFPRQPAHTS